MGGSWAAWSLASPGPVWFFPVQIIAPGAPANTPEVAGSVFLGISFSISAFVCGSLFCSEKCHKS